MKIISLLTLPKRPFSMNENHPLSPFITEEYKDMLVEGNLLRARPKTHQAAQEQTATVFSDKWNQYEHGGSDFEKMVHKQNNWYLQLYGFSNEESLSSYLNNCKLILDAGTGLGYKAAWFATLCPDAIVIAADISDSIVSAAKYYKNIKNLFFIYCDISHMDMFVNASFDYISCDQVIHHTSDPYKTFQELVRLTKISKEIAVYVYRKKSIPRELLDDYFRQACINYSHEELMELSKQVTQLGKVLSSIDQEVDIPDIPALGIEGGNMTFQRFLYWNFMKCFWNPDTGETNSIMTNYDWYSPSQAFRYTEEEFSSLDCGTADGNHSFPQRKSVLCRAVQEDEIILLALPMKTDHPMPTTNNLFAIGNSTAIPGARESVSLARTVTA